jgi:NodT family efflux transporter outer membrane factor (OMF) lipoprotein
VKRLIANAAIAVTVTLVFSCAKPPPRDFPDIDVDVPGEWTADSLIDTTAITIEAYESEWWAEFGISELDSLVNEALGTNFDLKTAIARVDQAEALARIVGADKWPQIGAGLEASRRQNVLIGFPIPGQAEAITTRTSSFGVSLDVAWEIDLWGRIRAAEAAALADVQASWADLAGLRLSVASQAVKAWFAVIEARLQVELAEETVRSFRLSADFVRARYEEGVRSPLDLRLALANQYAAEALLELRKEILDRTVRGFEILLGRYPSGQLIAQGDLPAVEEETPPGLPSELLIRRPDLLAAERRYAASEKRVSEARRAFFPRISLTGSAGTLTAELENLVDGDFSVWSIAARLAQPIFQGGRLKGNLAQSEAVADQALAQYALSLLRAFGEVESALYAEQVLERRVERTRAAAEQSQAAQLLAERQYAAGIVDYITVLETQRRALNSQSELLSVRRERIDARVNLHLALGGGFNLNEQWMEFLKAQDGENQSETDEQAPEGTSE